MVGELTGSLGVGIGELAADHDLIRLHSVKVTADLVELAEEVADVVLGTRVQDLEIGEKLHGSVPTEKSRWSKADQECSIDREEDNVLPQTGMERRRSVGGALADALVVCHLF